MLDTLGALVPRAPEAPSLPCISGGHPVGRARGPYVGQLRPGPLGLARDTPHRTDLPRSRPSPPSSSTSSSSRGGRRRTPAARRRRCVSAPSDPLRRGTPPVGRSGGEPAACLPPGARYAQYFATRFLRLKRRRIRRRTRAPMDGARATGSRLSNRPAPGPRRYPGRQCPKPGAHARSAAPVSERGAPSSDATAGRHGALR